MKTCVQIDRIEDLALGLLDEEDAARARAHLEACVECRDQHEHFVEERSLFAHRAAVTAIVEPPPYLAPAVLAAENEDRRGPFARVLPALLAVAACVAGLAGVGELRRSYDSEACPPVENEIALDGSGAIESAGLISTNASFHYASMAPRASEDVVACTSAPARPTASVLRVAHHVSDEGVACAATNRETCEEPLFTSWRVTSMSAMP
jgi:anti-sigma factor RsiW